MKRFFLLVFVCVPILVSAQSKNFLDIPYLETAAQVDTLVKPDRIYLSITIREKDSKGRKSVEEQENQMAQALKNLGINVDEQLSIKNLASTYKAYFLRSKDVLKRKQYSLLVYDGLMAGKVMAALENLDIANTYLEKTEYVKMDELELTLKMRAVKKAKRKAESLTQPLGQKVGKAIHIIDHARPYYPQRPQPRSEMAQNMLMAKAAVEPLDIGFESIRVEASVNIKFQLTN